jgi:hypothetical protein
MAPDNKPGARQLYLDGLRELAAKHGDEYALLTAATTMAMYQLSDPPLFLPPEAPPTKGEKH